MKNKLNNRKKVNKKKSLSGKIFLLSFILISIALTTLGTFSCIITSNSVKDSTEKQLKENTAQTAELVKQAINSVDSSIGILSLNEVLAANVTEESKSKAEYFKYLSTIQKENSDLIEELIITDNLGKGILSSASETYSVDLSNRDYVQKTLKGSKNISNVLFSKTTGQPIIEIAYPLKLNDKIVGTVVATIKFDSISKHVAKVKVGTSGYSYIIDKNGLFLYHPKSEKVLKENLCDDNNADLKTLLDKMKSDETAEGYYTYDGVRKFASFTQVDNFVVVVTTNYDEYMSVATAIKKSIIIIGIISLVISMGLSHIFAIQNIINPIKHLQNLMIKAGDGDLTGRAKIQTKDEIQIMGEYFNEMIGNQSDIITNVRKDSKELASASNQISASIEKISSSTKEISNSIQEVADNAQHQNNSVIEASEVLVQLSSLVQIAQNRASTAKNNSENTMNVAQEGRTKVKRTIEAIQDISKATTETADILMVLNELSKKVNGIINTINNISNQTNLLALNASIEAARAGEHGKGFTIVADEVRKLSEETNIGSNEISSLVNEMVLEIDKAVKSMSIGKQAVDNGIIIASKTDKSFVNIIGAVEQIVKDINLIVDITKDEVTSSNQIVKLIGSVTTIAETTVAHSEEVAAATEEQSAAIESLAASSEETSAMANSLNSLIEKFKI